MTRITPVEIKENIRLIELNKRWQQREAELLKEINYLKKRCETANEVKWRDRISDKELNRQLENNAEMWKNYYEQSQQSNKKLLIVCAITIALIPGGVLWCLLS